MKKIFKIIFILTLCLSINLLTVKADNKYNKNDYYIKINDSSNIPQSFKSGQGYVPASEAQLTDYIGYFVGNNTDWNPRIKFLGSDKNNIEAYVFCLSFHDLAPSSNIEYSKDDWDEATPEKMNQVRYIIQRGFLEEIKTMDYNDEDFKWHYYVTQLAIWQLQHQVSPNYTDKNGNVFDISSWPTDNTATKQEILNLVETAINETIDSTKNVAKYIPNNQNYQILVPALIYYTEPVVDIPDENPPQEENQEKPIITKVSISYKDKCTNKYVQKAKMQLLDSSNKVVKQWTSTEEDYVISNLKSGLYNLKDATNNLSKQIQVENKSTVQHFELITNPDTCEQKVEENPKTGLIKNTIIAIALLSSIILYFFARKKLIKIRYW